MYIKMLFPTAAFYFLENRPAPALGNISYGGAKHISDRPWLAIGLVLCAHLAVFAALARQHQSLPLETMPEPIMVSLLSAPQAAPQKPALPPAKPTEQLQKPIKKPVKTPISKPVVPIIKPASLPAAPSVEQPPMPATPTSSPATEAQAKPTNNKAADTQAYQSPSFNAAYLNNPAPNYPSVSRRLGEQGLVLLRVQVTADGTAESVELQTGSGSSRLDQAALEAVKKWQFVPAKRGEQSVSASV
ncbi:MAG TPA: energy transducer TonB, partial [Methylobacter sp.]